VGLVDYFEFLHVSTIWG